MNPRAISLRFFFSEILHGFFEGVGVWIPPGITLGIPSGIDVTWTMGIL